jgi:hypothetical protein
VYQNSLVRKIFYYEKCGSHWLETLGPPISFIDPDNHYWKCIIMWKNVFKFIGDKDREYKLWLYYNSLLF